MQFGVSLATSCRAVTSCMNVSYVVGHERANSHRVYSVDTGNVFMGILEVLCTI
jgi:hypothetical protein